MNPNAPFGGQPPGVFQAPSKSSSGMIQVQPPLQFGQLTLFGPSSGGEVKNPGFTPPSDFTRASELRGSPGQTLGFGQPLGFTQSYPFGHAPLFGATSTPTSSSIAGKQEFSFKPPTNLGTSQASLKFGNTSGEISGGVFSGPDFSFKTPENAVFKPIFGIGSEPEKTQSQTIPNPFTFSFPGESGSGRLAPFGISQETSSSSTTPHFSFSKPVSNSATLSSSLAATPGKTVEDAKKGPINPFGSPSGSFASFSYLSGGSSRPEHEEYVALSESVEKGTKRKEEQDHSLRRRDYDTADEPELQSRSDYSSNKRLVRLSRPRVGGLFSVTLQDVLKSNKDNGRPKKESKTERVSLESGDLEQMSAAGGSQSGLALARPSMLQKEEENKAKQKEKSPVSNPLRRNRNSGSTESLGGLPSSELKAFQCKNIPDYLNDRTVLEKHFKKFVKIHRIYTNRRKKLAIVHCLDHASAALARKKAKGLHKEIVTFWLKKKPSPNKREYSPKEQAGDVSEGRQKPDPPSHQHSLQSKSIRATAGGNLLSKSSPVKKPGLKKSLQFETETFDSGSESHGSENLVASASSLSNLIGMVAESSEDKYRLLDQRDKIMRQARVKRTDLAQTFIGTCPDMCPEKERYMRETRNQLSVFEVVPGTDKVDHAAAVKEYSRSSADQEEPLPHELRPLEVLSMTMDYLVTQIMDKGEGNFREWYDFVWNRTRGIRKDITQQHLCSPLTVSLIEKCTRFHIHCSHHLCEEPLSSFEAKINNENLTKCLQSLKEMYQDLASKQVYCKNEAEFRGYNVLLNLNKGDILREVQQFRPEVRNSTEVRFAVQAFAALNSNNFVRFFKLVQAASYLNACLLHCYFSQIRRDSLRSLNIAYTVNAQRSTIFPLDNMVHMLLFGESESASDFISYYGLSVSDGFVELNRSAFLERESLPKPKKSPFVSQKLTGLVGEIVCGGPLPAVTCHIPVCSFNELNKYTGESAAVDLASSSQKANANVSEARAEGGDMDLEPLLVSPLQPAPLPAVAISTFQPLPQPSQPPPPPPPKPQPAYCDTDVAEVLEELVHDVLEAECREVSTAGAAYVHSAIRISDSTADELITEAMLETLRQIASSTLYAERERLEEEKRQAEEERRKQEREQSITMLSQSLGAEFTEEVVKEIAGEISAKELKYAVAKDQRARVARCSKEVCAEIVGVFLEEEIFHCAKETLQELQCFCKYLQRWREAVIARKKLRRQMRAFPAAPCCVDPQNRLKALLPSAECPIARENLVKGIVDLGHAGRLGTSCCRLVWLRQKMNHQMRVQHFYQQLLCDAVWTPLDLPSLVAENFPMQQEKVFWKVLLVLPSYEEFPVEDPSRILADWLKAKFTIDKNVKDTASMADDGLQTLALHTSLHVQGDQAVCVNVCVKASHGILGLPELEGVEAQKELFGTSGLILLLPPRVRSEDMAEEDVYWLSALLQLKRLLQGKPFHPLVPLVVFVPSHGGGEAIEKEAEEGLMLPDLISANLISDYIIVEMPDSVSDLQGTSKLTEATQWLVAQCPSPPHLCCQTLTQYVEDGIDREFSQHFYQDRKERREAGLPSQDPSAIIELYNSVVQFLAEVASSEELHDLSWPVTEFAEPGGSKALPHLRWNTPSHSAWLKKALLSFQIPQMDLPPLGAPWRPVYTMILQYLSQTASSPQTQAILQSQIESLLSNAYVKWRGRLRAGSEEDGPSVEEIPWDNILALCINHKLRDWKPPRLPVAPEAVSKDGQVQVYFVKEHLRKFVCPSLWEEARLKTQKEAQQSQGRSMIKSQVLPQPYFHSFSPAKYDASVRNVSDEELRVSSAADLTLTVSHLDRLPERLSAKLQLEKTESRRFDEQLQQFLVNDSEPSWDPQSLPLYLPEALVSRPQMIPPVVKRPVPRSPEDDTQVLKDTDPSLAHRLQYLKHLLRASKEEEVACGLHLSTVLDMTNA